MKRAICIPFHKYGPPAGDSYRSLMDPLIAGLKIWGGEFDKLYLIDDEWVFSLYEINQLKASGIDFKIFQKVNAISDWLPHPSAFDRVKEDHCLFIDFDVIINKAGIVDGWFRQAESGKFVSAFDSSGGMRDVVHEKFPKLKEMGSHRLGSYYFILNREQLKIAANTQCLPINFETGTYIPEIDYTTKEGDWVDAFGLLTIKILATGVDIYEIEDDRGSILLTDDNTISRSPQESKQLGYYHMRAGGYAAFLVGSKFCGVPSCEETYLKAIKEYPRSETLRILAWNYVVACEMRKPILSILEDMNVPSDLWQQYIVEFRKYHNI